MAPNGDKPLVQTSDEIEDEGAVAGGFTQISEVVGGGLEWLAVVGDRQVPLDKCAEFGIEDESARLPIAEKMALNGKPGGTGSVALVATMPNNVVEVVGQGAVEPEVDDTVHALPVW
jgi:hypothetical protein